MSWEPRPLPEVTPETAPFWEGAERGELRLCECTNCGLVYYYPRSRCPDCFGEAKWVSADGSGTLYSYTVSHQIEGWPDEALPVIVGYVELAEGPRLVSTIVDCEPETVSVGMDLSVGFQSTNTDGIGIPVFVPDP